MKPVWSALAGILIMAIFVTSLCAQSCVDPLPSSAECPAHQSSPGTSSGKDCCKHEDGTSDRATVAALSASAHRSLVHMPVHAVYMFAIEDRVTFGSLHPVATLQTRAPNIRPTSIPLALRI